MNHAKGRTIRYAVGVGCVLMLLILAGWLARREDPLPAGVAPFTPQTSLADARPIGPLLSKEVRSRIETRASQPVEPPPTNAAVIYRQAFALYAALSKEQKELISDWRTNVDASVEAELCEKIRPICDLMHQAASITNCDWGLEQPITFDTPLRHLNSCRGIARAGVWSAAHCRASESAGTVDDLVDAARVGQNTSPCIIGYLVDLAIQGIVIDFAAQHADTLAGGGDTRLMQLFNDAHFEQGLYSAIEQEADMQRNEAEQLATMPPEEVRHFLAELTNDYSNVESITPDQAISNLNQVAELYREFPKGLELPEQQYREWLAHLQAIEETNPFAGILLANIRATVNRTQAMTVRSAMLVAGLAVMQSGSEALQSHPDPATGQPFAYRRTADGFELQSSYQFNDQSLKLSFK